MDTETIRHFNKKICVFSTHLGRGTLEMADGGNYDKLKNKNKICGSQLPKESHQSNRLLCLIGRWQYDRIMRLKLRSVKSINVDFPNQNIFSIK